MMMQLRAGSRACGALQAAGGCRHSLALPVGAAAAPTRHQQHQHHQQQQLCLAPLSGPARRRNALLVRAAPTPDQQQQQQQQDAASSSVVYNKEFGYSRKDVLIIIVALIGLGVVMYEGLQAAGMDAGMAGNVVQATIFLGICIGWVSTYLWRVANKKMTYAKQLEMYEEAVMQKRLDEMTEAELAQMLADVEADKARLAAQKAAMQQQQRQQ